MKYNKLVRDKIPEIIRNSKKECNFRILNQEEYKSELIKKLYEEIEEYKLNPCIEELADIKEVFDALLKIHYISLDEILTQQFNKRRRNGSFDKGIFLIEVF